MGAFFTNVQIRVREDGEAAKLLEALRSDAAARGMDEVTDGSASDRSVSVLPPDAGGWVAVYDEATESQDHGVYALAANLSRALGGCAFTVLVHDSDVLEMRLFDRGDEVDVYNSAPEYFGEKLSQKERARVAGNPARWAEVLPAGAKLVDLRAAWDAEDTFAEDTLVRVCKVLECDTRRATVGYRYAQAQEFPTGTVHLHFRLRARPGYEGDAVGLPRLDSSGGSSSMALAQDDMVRVGATARNIGGASQGVSVIVWGTAVDQTLVSLDVVEWVPGDPRKLRGVFGRHTPVERRSATGEPIWVVDLGDESLPAGMAGGDGWHSGSDVNKYMDARLRSQIHVNVVGRAERVGKGELHVALQPHANRTEGAATITYGVSVDPPLRRPLRVRPPDGFSAQSLALRPLLGRRNLIALLVIDRPREAAVSYARDALDALVAIAGTSDKLSTAVFRRKGQKPKVGRGASKTLLKGKRLEALLDAMVHEPVVTIEGRDGPEFDDVEGPVQARWGVGFGTFLLGTEESDRVPTLLAWADGQALGESAIDALEGRWGGILGRAMEDGGVQGSLHRSGWTAAGSVDYTAYEVACGTAGDHVTRRAWVKRWIRVPGDERLWLGASLVRRLSQAARERLGAIAEVVPCGKGLALRLHRREDVGAFEEALAELLPSEEDVRAATS